MLYALYLAGKCITEAHHVFMSGVIDENKWAATCGFHQCGILTSVDSDKAVQPLFSLETPNDAQSVA